MICRARRVVVAVWQCPNTFACWLCRAYPDWSPQTGHVALVALCGQDGPQREQKLRSTH